MLFDTQLRAVDQAYMRVHATHRAPGWVEQDPDELVESISLTVGKVVPADSEIVAAGLANQGETIVAWDRESGKALAPAIVWQDKRSMPIVDRIKASGLSSRILADSQLPLDPYFSSTKFRWLMENVPSVQQAQGRGTLVLGTSDVWLRHRFNADIATDPSTASRTQLLDLVSGRWHQGLLQAFDLDEETMPRIHPTVGDLGTLRHRSWQAELPLRASLVDQQAALAGHGCFEPGGIKATYGTGVFILSNTGHQVGAIPGLLPTVAWQIGERLTYAVDGGVFSAGAAIDWLRDVLRMFDDEAETAQMACSVPDSGGVMFLPALAGLGAPWWLPNATGAITGLRSTTRPEHIVRAALEGIAQRVADIVERVRGEVEVPLVAIDGGLTRNEFLVQYQADLLGIPLALPSTNEITARGAALLAGLGAGVFATEEVAAENLQPSAMLMPRQSDKWRLQERAKWREFVKQIY